MLPPIWTPDALLSEQRPYRGTAWRLVEAQHRVSTLKLVDSLSEQALLEDILEETKPPIPADCQGLDYLLVTPFRYRPYPHGSRFRRAGLTPGVWYGAERAETALAEMVFYRFLFYAESPATPFPTNAADYTGFSVPIAAGAVDLTSPALADPAWLNPTDYAACQALADTARGIGAGVIRYQSIRDPQAGANLAVLTCSAFAAPAPKTRQTWRIRIGPQGGQALCDHPRKGLEFGREAFDDPRLKGMVWLR
ncbi:MAG: RES family NAD+ phosphorylase [Rhodobacteraceae bacterium]|nr:RES family NAD+ phosphorylase [Paracoccaceae bacterium]MCF8514329.1 RES family NAD+ phosphorylase [Paracoccaceae bacterium]MCF8518573.1 RES family NAD+ phosphorylase [Paracoccaceae bacterium]